MRDRERPKVWTFEGRANGTYIFFIFLVGEILVLVLGEMLN